jgi:hypothetical protein
MEKELGCERLIYSLLPISLAIKNTYLPAELLKQFSISVTTLSKGVLSLISI